MRGRWCVAQGLQDLARSEARRFRAEKPYRNEGEGDKLAIRCQQVPFEEVFFIAADNFGSNLKLFERVQGSPELNRLGRTTGYQRRFVNSRKSPDRVTRSSRQISRIVRYFPLFM